MAIPRNIPKINIDDFTGFRWNGKHTSELGLKAVTSSSRYNLNPISSIKNEIVDIPGGDGQYFFGSRYEPKKWTAYIAFDNLDEYQWRELQQWLYHTDISDFVFDECPYKAYGAKLDGTPDIKYLCFDEDVLKEDSEIGNRLNSQDKKTETFLYTDGEKTDYDSIYYKKRIYKGEGTLNFIAPFPFAYSARDLDGNYMKFLDKIAFFPNLSEKYEYSCRIGNTFTLSGNFRRSILLDSIYGSTEVDPDTFQFKRGQLGLTDEGEKISFRINRGKEKVLQFDLKDGFQYFDKIDIPAESSQIIADTIKFNDTIKQYQLIKRVGEKKIKVKFNNNSNSASINISTEANNSADYIIEDLDLSLIEDELNSISLPLKSDKFIYIARPAENEDGEITIRENSFYIEDSIRENQITLTFLKNTNTDSIEEITLLYPLKEEKTYDLIQSKPAQLIFNEYKDITLNVRNHNGAKEGLEYQFNFTIIPSLYDNYDEWKDASGLKDSQRIDESDIYYDRPHKIEDSNYTFRYQVYNGGDLPTPFKLTLPLQYGKVEFSDAEISFLLVHQDDFNKTLDEQEEVNNILGLDKQTPYAIDKNGEYIYYFQKIYNYETGKVLLFNSNTGESLIIENISNNPLYKRKSLEENNVLAYFSLRINNTDSDKSYAALIQSLTALADNNNSDTKNVLEIDTNKQTINFINEYNNQKQIIPMYFSLCRGNLFKIPPQLDNLYILVYNKREENKTFISDDIKQYPDIDYRYLYL